MSYKVIVIDNDDNKVVMQENNVEVLVGAQVVRVDSKVCNMQQFIRIKSSLRGVASGYLACKDVLKDLESRYPKLRTDAESMVKGVSFSNFEDLEKFLKELEDKANV